MTNFKGVFIGLVLAGFAGSTTGQAPAKSGEISDEKFNVIVTQKGWGVTALVDNRQACKPVAESIVRDHWFGLQDARASCISARTGHTVERYSCDHKSCQPSQ